MRYLRTVVVILTAACLAVACSGTAPSGGSQTKTVNWWGWAPGPLAPQFIAAFNKAHPDIKVIYKNISFSDYVNALRLGLTSDAGPDVFDIQAGEIAQKYSRFAVDLAPLAQRQYGSGWKDRIFAKALPDFFIGGHQTGLPVQVVAAGTVWYNKTLLDQFGVQPPKTWDELLSACQRIKQHHIACFAQGAKDAWINEDMYITLANDLAPGKFYDAVAGKVQWTDPALVKAFTMWGELFKDGVFQQGALGIAHEPDALHLWAQGKAAMIMDGTWNAYVMTDKGLATAQGRSGVPNPRYTMMQTTFPNVSGNGQPGALFGGSDYGLAINRRSKAHDAAWTFVNWLTMQQGGQQLVAGQQFIPSLKGVAISKAGLVAPAVQTPIVQHLPSLMTQLAGYRQIPYPDLESALSDALAAVAAGQQKPDQAAASVQQASASVHR